MNAEKFDFIELEIIEEVIPIR